MFPGFYYILILVLSGVSVGFTTGLLGIGGGFIMVPIIYSLLSIMGVDSTLAIRMAFATSLAAIIPTALSSAYGHQRKQTVIFKAVLYLGVSGFIGGILGGDIASHLPGDLLKIIFSLVLLAIAVRMLIFKEPEEDTTRVENIPLFILWGLIAGVMSGLVGIGGGVILIPVMVMLLNFNMKEASGTSSAVIVLTSLGGISSYILNGINISGLPAYSIGYVNLLILLILVIFTIPLAQVGAWASHKSPEKLLRYILVIILVYTSLYLLGVFQYLNLTP